MTKKQKIDERYREIDALPAEKMTEEEKASLAEAEAMDDGTTMSLEELKESLEGYSGHIIVRIPKSLHKKLKEEASIEGVSLNQYILYKLE